MNIESTMTIPKKTLWGFLLLSTSGIRESKNLKRNMGSQETQIYQDSWKGPGKPSQITSRDGIVDAPGNRLSEEEKVRILETELAEQESKLELLELTRSIDIEETHSLKKACSERIATIKKELESYQNSMDTNQMSGLNQMPLKRSSLITILIRAFKRFLTASKTK